MRPSGYWMECGADGGRCSRMRAGSASLRGRTTVDPALKRATVTEKIYVRSARQARPSWLRSSWLTAEIAEDADDLTER
jgi:hypothetical protein